jgi:hypothetical protein
MFLLLVLIGYLAGIAWKLSGANFDWVILLYAVNAIMVVIDILLYRKYMAKI